MRSGVDIDLAGRVALVTGAGAGIGQEIARTLSRAGAAVAANDIDSARAADTVGAITVGGQTATAVPGDVTDEDEVEAVVAATVAQLGRLDIAVNNVGMMGGLGPRSVVDVDAAYARAIIDLNLTATVLCCAAEARAMSAANAGGVIINVSSGETTRSAPALAVYAAAKAAVNHFTRSLALELGPAGIRVHAIAPGTTPTEEVRARLPDDHLAAIARATPLGRLCEPADLAGLVVFLASDLASAITGQLILADAGAHLSLSRPAIPVAPQPSIADATP